MSALRVLALCAVLVTAAAGCSSEPAAAPMLAVPSPVPGTVVHTTEVPALHPSVDDYAAGVAELVAGDGTTHRLAVRVAVTAEQKAHGLMEVPDVPAGTGMAFPYDTDRTGAFTMRGTLTPLQIAWVDVDGVVVAMADMTPCAEEPCPTWSPDATYRLALEVRAGWFDEVGVGLGDRVELLSTS